MNIIIISGIPWCAGFIPCPARYTVLCVAHEQYYNKQVRPVNTEVSN